MYSGLCGLRLSTGKYGLYSSERPEDIPQLVSYDIIHSFVFDLGNCCTVSW